MSNDNIITCVLITAILSPVIWTIYKKWYPDEEEYVSSRIYDELVIPPLPTDINLIEAGVPNTNMTDIAFSAAKAAILTTDVGGWIGALTALTGGLYLLVPMFCYLYPTAMARPLFFQSANMWLFTNEHVKIFQINFNLKDVKEEDITPMERLLPKSLHSDMEICRALLGNTSSDQWRMTFKYKIPYIWTPSGEVDYSVMNDDAKLLRAFYLLPPQVQPPLINVTDLPWLQDPNLKLSDETPMLEKTIKKYEKIIAEPYEPFYLPPTIPPMTFKDYISVIYQMSKSFFIHGIYYPAIWLFLNLCIFPFYYLLYLPIINIPWFITKAIPYWWYYRLKHEKQMTWRQIFAIMFSCFTITYALGPYFL